MGASAGTGVRSFAEGGSTSSPNGEASAAPSGQIYRPQYEDYGLGSTPQAQGQLAALLNMGSYGNQMPTFTRPQAPPPQAQYSIPYGPSIPQRGMNIPRMFGRPPANREQSLQNLARDYQQGNLTEAAYNNLMQNPETSLALIRRIDSGEDLTARTPPPIQYMTAAQQKAYNDKMSRELSEILTPRTVFNTSNYDPGSAGG